MKKNLTKSWLRGRWRENVLYWNIMLRIVTLEWTEEWWCHTVKSLTVGVRNMRRKSHKKISVTVKTIPPEYFSWGPSEWNPSSTKFLEKWREPRVERGERRSGEYKKRIWVCCSWVLPHLGMSGAELEQMLNEFYDNNFNQPTLNTTSGLGRGDVDESSDISAEMSE